MARNKNRLYIAFFERSSGGGHYHAALLYTPKNPAVGAGAAQDTTRFRVARRPGADAADGRWEFRAESVPNRSRHVGALILLGKAVQTAEELGTLLAHVTLSSVDDCMAWTVEAVQVRASRPYGVCAAGR